MAVGRLCNSRFIIHRCKVNIEVTTQRLNTHFFNIFFKYMFLMFPIIRTCKRLNIIIDAPAVDLRMCQHQPREVSSVARVLICAL